MKKEFEVTHNIRGSRYAIKLTKEVKGIPGFAPEYRTCDVGDVVVKFLDNEPPYFQCFTEPPILKTDEIEEILDLMKRGYIKEDFNDR